jgi:DNA topoisomerase-1
LSAGIAGVRGARMARLRRTNPNTKGITRRRAGRGFCYYGPDGRRLTDEPTLERIRALVLPPAWTDVWICPWPNGHIQALGTDVKGRRQYRYHDDWRKRRDAEKFDHMVVFAQALPALRAKVDEHLRERGFSRNRVLVCATRLLELGFFRIGSEGYAEENNTFGLATMRKRHVTVKGDVITFDYVAKSGKRRVQSVVDADIAKFVSKLKARRGGGHELLAYRDGTRWVDVKSADINAYLKEQTGENISAKDFRTWNATMLCAVGLARQDDVASSAAQKRVVAAAVKEVAEYLGNTPAVCRSSYIDPRVVDQLCAGRASERLGVATSVLEAGSIAEVRAQIETAIIAMLAPDPDPVRAAA